MKTKIETALRYITDKLATSSAPVVCWSGGKDSQMLLFLVRQITKELPIAYFQLAEDARKDAWIHEMSNVWDLRLHIMQPCARDLAANGSHVEVLHFFQIGEILLHVGMQSSAVQKSNMICAVKQHLSATSDDKMDADLIFHGHKSSDTDTMYGPVRLKSDSFRWGNTELCYPLRDWTDADIWAASEYLNVPQNYRRYDRTTKQKLPSDAFNNDYYPLCSNCIQPGQTTKTVACPKVGTIDYVADQFPLQQNFAAYQQLFSALYE
jgi:3'-phosphoadenosine 5'-phosphosulfate sulfotransferase (PAPS reductase)/FAD synthetase